MAVWISSSRTMSFFSRALAIRISILVYFLFVMFIASAWSPPALSARVRVMPPKSSNDWQQLASLLVTVFDKESGLDGWELLKWKSIEKLLTEQHVLKIYSKTARRMEGNKYAVLLAKEGPSVIGMVEMGLSCHAADPIISEESLLQDKNCNSTNIVGATIGVLAVHPDHQGRGIGQALLKQCEVLALSEGWKEDVLYAAVDPLNQAALRFFCHQGYSNKEEKGKMFPVTVRQKRNYENLPHLLLSKNLTLVATVRD